MTVDSTTIGILLAALPIVAAIAGWAVLWRRNTMLCSVRGVHFCGDELLQNGFWAPAKSPRPPLIDAIYITFKNFGLKHLDRFEFASYNVSDDAVFHPCHGNNLPVTSFSFERGDRGLLKVTVLEIPAFETFSIAILNTHPSRGFRPVASEKNYVLKPRRKYVKKMTWRLVLGLIAIVAIALAVEQFV